MRSVWPMILCASLVLVRPGLLCDQISRKDHISCAIHSVILAWQLVTCFPRIVQVSYLVSNYSVQSSNQLQHSIVSNFIVN
ncbi:hypothetical protein HanIR_Chr14g0699171 [Helianthus annuus]|nr:hypothetical protein HanIR_Chr14g0699171 [Helianthus annuus]